MVDLVSRNHAEQVEASWQIPERRVDECLSSEVCGCLASMRIFSCWRAMSKIKEFKVVVTVATCTNSTHEND